MDYVNMKSTRRANLRVVVLVFLISRVLLAVGGYDVKDMKGLKTKLFSDGSYDKTIRPVLNQSEPIRVNVGLSLTSIVDFSMTNGKLETTGYVIAWWTDHGLMWNSTDYGGITRLNIEQSYIWMPEIKQINTIGEHFSVSTAFFESNGRVVYMLTSEFKTICTLNMRFYPKDEHTCEIALLSSKYQSAEVNLVQLRDTVDLANFKENGEWTLKRSHSFKRKFKEDGVNIETDQIINYLVLSRIPDFNLLHKCAPLFLILVANLFVHMVPVMSGERISYAVTLLLAFVFWVAIVTEELPHNSSKISLLSIMMTLSMFMSTVTVVFSVVLCRLAVEKYHPIPRSLYKLAAWKIRKGRSSGKSIKYKGNDSFNMPTHSSLESEINGEQNRSANTTEEETKNESQQSSVESNISQSRAGIRDIDVEITWLDISDTLDIIGGAFNVIVVLIVGVTFLVMYLDAFE